MVEQILRSISRSMSQVGQETGQFRKAAADQNKSIGSFIKDISKMFSSQNKQQASINSSLDDIQYNSQQTNTKVSQSNDLIQESISIQTQMLSELKSVAKGIGSLIEGLGLSGPGGGEGIGSKIASALTMGGIGLGAGMLGGAGMDLMSRSTGIDKSEFSNEQYGGSTSLASTNLAPEEKAILETIAGGESSGKYNIVNYVAGGGSPSYFSDMSKHPFKGESGYTAAGRYQFLWNTWKNELSAMGEDPDSVSFSPENQDRVALSHAKRVYQQKTGQDLIEDIKNPELHSAITSTLRPTWHGIKGGSYLGSAYETFKGGTTPEGDGDVMAMSGPVNLQKYSLKSPEHVQGLNGGFQQKLGKFFQDAEASGHDIKLYSGYRSPERQKELFANAIQKYGSPEAARRWVAPPGRSKHNYGLAADLQFLTPGAKEWAHQNASKYGLHFRMGHEPWHIEPIGASSTVTPSMAESFGGGSIPSGGALGLMGGNQTGNAGYDQYMTQLGGMGMYGAAAAMLTGAGTSMLGGVTGISLDNLMNLFSGGEQDSTNEQVSSEEGSENIEGDGDIMKVTKLAPQTTSVDTRAMMIEQNASQTQIASQMPYVPVSDKTQYGDTQGPTGYTNHAGNMSLNGLKDTTLPDWYRSLFGVGGGRVVPDNDFYKTLA